MKEYIITKKSIISILYTLLLLLTFSCSNTCHKLDKLNQQQIDSLINSAEDSMASNIPFVRAKVKYAMSLVKDSLQYYEVFLIKAFSHLRTDSYDSAFAATKKILRFCQGLPPSPRMNIILSNTNNILGIYYSRIGNQDSSIYHFHKAYNQNLSGKKAEALPNILINLADAYTIKGDLPNATLYFRKALFTSDSLNIIDRMGFPIYFGLGQIYMNLRDFELSDLYFRKAEATFENRDLNEKFVFCNNRGNFYYYKEEYSNALPWFQKARALVYPKNYIFAINLCELNMSDIYLHLNQLDSAKYYSDKSYPFFYKINHRTALYYLTTIKAGIALKQSNVSLAHTLLKSANDTSGIEPNMISIRNKCLNDYYQKIGDYKQAYQYLQNSFRIDNTIQSERVKNRVAELDMRYKQDTSLLKRDILIQSQQNRMNYLRLTKYLWLLACIIVLGVATFVYIYMRKQRNLQRIKHLNQITKLRMESIRNRISPHFIFNILNHEINSGDEEKENTKLPDLVKILRRSLEVSEHLSVTLAQELEFVQTYIGLEQKSLGNNFTLSWEMDNQVNYSKLSIPAMIIQIPVENAIKHALRGKEGAKELCVSVSKQGNGASIVIRDNGAGYQPNGINKQGTGTGLKVIYQTIQLLNAKNEERINFSISNRNNNELNGTQVEIFVPEVYSYEI